MEEEKEQQIEEAKQEHVPINNQGNPIVRLGLG